ncbi:S-methyl-5-thioribose-1-phosphate isomerase [Leptospirillum ferriphilum]|uniref:Methylthioribose-1-phosphate isomerase n=1 Tax=Leptospirillum ferriphilum (strain ML-04) TaxID=1048260 RepID=J9ZAI1_LEPFM|nr:S-methyl-5-thioribose-1-phosphate isomerase [Leptospirillum ferriphilum]AFS53499.1 translation initiation factor, aIF-2BI/5-methylthioribose-1-phosphate isomerase [Leptospirillum ferriphilum ML-04]
MIDAVRWVRTPENQHEVHVLDQRLLPLRTEFMVCRTASDMATAIRDMVVRGAPAIGIAAAFGVALGSQSWNPGAGFSYQQHMEETTRLLGATRPTAVNLFWALERMRALWATPVIGDPSGLTGSLFLEAQSIKDEDIRMNRKMGDHGQALLPDSATVLTHCNAGALATGGFGTALGVIRAAVSAGKTIRVFADETRPYLQGARLTAYELVEDGIPTTLITDGMGASLMAKKKIDAVIVGADRVTANGDVANKIGTYALAVLARAHGIPFYVAAPFSTIDFSLKSGSQIPIEERSPREITHFGPDVRIAPEGVSVYNPAFDVTPGEFITAIITEKGVFRPDEIRQLAPKSN